MGFDVFCPGPRGVRGPPGSPPERSVGLPGASGGFPETPGCQPSDIRFVAIPDMASASFLLLAVGCFGFFGSFSAALDLGSTFGPGLAAAFDVAFGWGSEPAAFDFLPFGWGSVPPLETGRSFESAVDSRASNRARLAFSAMLPGL